MATMSEDANDSLWDASVTGKSWVELAEEEDEEFARLNNSCVVGGKITPASSETNKTPPVTIKEEVIDDEYDDNPLKNFGKPVDEDLAENIKKEIKRELQKDFLVEDISLTGHLDKFQLVSPCKTEPKEPKRFLKDCGNIVGDHEERESEVRVPKRKIVEERALAGTIPDEVLMPSPSKVSKLTPDRMNLRRKRLREQKSVTPKGSDKKKPTELETDPEVLARRQKQIDYGKNTVGYDRYRQLVPKDARKAVHPKTPPLHLKYSRRAWDGLIKVWRKRLHFWDPPSEGGGNPELLEGSDFSDVSSTDGSLPSTPVQDLKRRHKITRESVSSSEENEEDFLNQGCRPLGD